jgi:hypothetical protein
MLAHDWLSAVTTIHTMLVHMLCVVSVTTICVSLKLLLFGLMMRLLIRLHHQYCTSLSNAWCLCDVLAAHLTSHRRQHVANSFCHSDVAVVVLPGWFFSNSMNHSSMMVGMLLRRIGRTGVDFPAINGCLGLIDTSQRFSVEIKNCEDLPHLCVLVPACHDSWPMSDGADPLKEASNIEIQVQTSLPLLQRTL